MKNLLILTILTLTGCATAASYNNTCFQENSDFGLAVNCTKEKMSSDPRSHIPTNANFVSSLYPFMDMVSSEVQNGKMSPAQGQYLIAEKINQLDGVQRDRFHKQQVLQTLSKPAPAELKTPTTTNCHVFGNRMSCSSF